MASVLHVIIHVNYYFTTSLLSCSSSLFRSILLHYRTYLLSHQHHLLHRPRHDCHTFDLFMTKMHRTRPLDLHEIRSRIASSLDLKDLASCARVCQDWNDSFSPPLYSSVFMSKRGPSKESVERNKYLIRYLSIPYSLHETLSSTSARDTLICSLLANSTLVSLDLSDNSIGATGAVTLSRELKANSTLTILNLESNWIRDRGAVALSKALRTHSSLIILNLKHNSIGHNGAVALFEALMTNSTLTSLDLDNNPIGPFAGALLSEVLMTNSTLAIVKVDKCRDIDGEFDRCVQYFSLKFVAMIQRFRDH